MGRDNSVFHTLGELLERDFFSLEGAIFSKFSAWEHLGFSKTFFDFFVILIWNKNATEAISQHSFDSDFSD